MGLFDKLKFFNTRKDTDVNDYVVFDLETTGLSVVHDDIIEIGAVKICNGKIHSRFHSLVNPRRPLFPYITEITGITQDMVEKAPTVDNVLPSFLNFIGHSILVGHNIASFDIAFIEACLQRSISNKVIDTLRLSMVCYPDFKSYKLDYLASAFGVEIINSHRALDDAITNYHVFEVIKRECQRNRIDLYSSSAINRAIVQKTIWQPNYTEDTLALQGLKDLLSNIISDNDVDISEVYLIKEWIDRNEHLRGNYPFDKVFLFLEKVLQDGIVEDSERNELLSIFNELLDPVNAAKHTRIDNLENKHFVLTGDFKCGSKTEVEQMIVTKGGIIDATVKKETNYVIVGALGSTAWTQGNYGGKIKKALEYNEKYANKGVCIEIIKEKDFLREYSKLI